MLNIMIMATSSIMGAMFMTMSHPLAMGLMLLLQTVTISLITGLLTQSFWFSYILFLVFLGGMLVLFIYVTSLASNEMFTLSTSSMFMAITPLILLMGIIAITDPMPWMNTMTNTETSNIISTLINQEESSVSLTKLYNQPTSTITLILVMYLFLTLIAVVKITSIFNGPLRQKN